MKYISSLILAGLCLITSCMTYQQFISVTPRTDVPKGSKEFIIETTMEKVLEAFKANQILYSTNESGCQTEEILLDEGTRARLNVYQLDNVVKIVPYWGITDKVRSNVALYAGYQQAALSSDEMKRIIYNSNELRPKMVFDYAVQVCSQLGTITYK